MFGGGGFGSAGGFGQPQQNPQASGPFGQPQQNTQQTGFGTYIEMLLIAEPATCLLCMEWKRVSLDIKSLAVEGSLKAAMQANCESRN